MAVKGLSNYGAMKLIKIENKIPCYTKESVERKIEAMQDRLDYLSGQCERLKRIEKDYKLWKDTLDGWSRWGIKKLIENNGN